MLVSVAKFYFYALDSQTGPEIAFRSGMTSSMMDEPRSANVATATWVSSIQKKLRELSEFELPDIGHL